MIENKDFLLINVHIPLEGNIPRTDLEIPFDDIPLRKNWLLLDILMFSILMEVTPLGLKPAFHLIMSKLKKRMLVYLGIKSQHQILGSKIIRE